MQCLLARRRQALQLACRLNIRVERARIYSGWTLPRWMPPAIVNQMNEPCSSPPASSVADDLGNRYGYFMTATEVAAELRLKSADALRMACHRGRIHLKPVAPNERPPKFATQEVARLIEARLRGEGGPPM